MTFGELAASLRQIDGQRDEGKHPPNFHFRSKPFPHFHNSPDRTYADVRFGGDRPPAGQQIQLTPDALGPVALNGPKCAASAPERTDPGPAGRFLHALAELVL